MTKNVKGPAPHVPLTQQQKEKITTAVGSPCSAKKLKETGDGSASQTIKGPLKDLTPEQFKAEIDKNEYQYSFDKLKEKLNQVMNSDQQKRVADITERISESVAPLLTKLKDSSHRSRNILFQHFNTTNNYGVPLADVISALDFSLTNKKVIDHVLDSPSLNGIIDICLTFVKLENLKTLRNKMDFLQDESNIFHLFCERKIANHMFITEQAQTKVDNNRKKEPTTFTNRNLKNEIKSKIAGEERWRLKI